MVKLKRVYEPAAASDGYRVLVERLWPRGVKKVDLALDAWEKDIAPSTELRKWFAHDVERWPEFERRYLQELKEPPASERLHELVERAAKSTITLLFSSHDEAHNNAMVLKKQIERRLRRRG